MLEPTICVNRFTESNRRSRKIFIISGSNIRGLVDPEIANSEDALCKKVLALVKSNSGLMFHDKIPYAMYSTTSRIKVIYPDGRSNEFWKLSQEGIPEKIRPYIICDAE